MIDIFLCCNQTLEAVIAFCFMDHLEHFCLDHMYSKGIFVREYFMKKLLFFKHCL